jgi:hypothetical protein
MITLYIGSLIYRETIHPNGYIISTYTIPYQKFYLHIDLIEYNSIIKSYKQENYDHNMSKKIKYTYYN